MKLYQLSRGDYFKVLWNTQIPPAALEVGTNTIYRLSNIDGMYSYCHDPAGNVIHIAAYAEVEKVDE